MNTDSNFPRLGHGIGLRPQHWNRILEEKTKVDWFEIVSENFMGPETHRIQTLEKIRALYPIVCHGVALSIGSADPLNQEYLNQLKDLVDRIQPAWVSDHFCWTSINNTYSHDLLPLPQTENTIQHVVDKINQVQIFLKRPIMLENISSYVTFKESDIPEWEFISEIAKRSGCKILLDINNIYVNSFNHKFDPLTYINGVSKEHIAQFHLAGHTNKGTYLYDTHSAKMIEATWDLYKNAVRKFGNIPTLIEWDSEIPELEILLEERNRAMEIEKHVHA